MSDPRLSSTDPVEVESAKQLQAFIEEREAGRLQRLEAIRALASGGKATPVSRVSWKSCDHRVLLRLLDDAIGAGGCVRLGATRDGGAWSIGVYCGDEYFTQYVREEGQLDGTLEDLSLYFTDAGNRLRTAGSIAGASSKSTKRAERGKH
jgi:hypothetical protein